MAETPVVFSLFLMSGSPTAASKVGIQHLWHGAESWAPEEYGVGVRHDEISRDLFRTMNVAIRDGRDFELDELDGEPVATIEAHPGPLLLFDAACPGYDLDEDRLVVDVHPGAYQASVLRFEPDSTTTLILMQLKRGNS